MISKASWLILWATVVSAGTTASAQTLTITTQPVASQTVPTGSTATLTIGVKGTFVLTFDWQQSTDQGSSWTTAYSTTARASGGVAESTYSFQAYPFHDLYLFRCQVSDTFGNKVVSSTAGFTVTFDPNSAYLVMTPTYTVIAANGGEVLLRPLFYPQGLFGPQLPQFPPPNIFAWSSDRPATVDISTATGYAVGLRAGTANITATLTLPGYAQSASAKLKSAGSIFRFSFGPDGLTRGGTYFLYVPAGNVSSSTSSLVLAYHGGNGDSQSLINAAPQLNILADQYNFLMAYPQGTPDGQGGYVWNGGKCCAPATTNNVDDVAFTTRSIADIGSKYAIDPTRIYVTGFSNGAIMSNRLACALSDRLAAIAPVSGGTEIDVPGEQPPGDSFNACNVLRPVPIMEFHGTTDQHYPYLGGPGPRAQTTVNHYPIPPVNTYGSGIPSQSAITDWLTRDNIPAASGSVSYQRGIETCVTYSTSSVNAQVTLCTANPPDAYNPPNPNLPNPFQDANGAIYDGGGHAWPGGVAYNAPDGDLPSPDIDASSAMWAFFGAYPLPVVISSVAASGIALSGATVTWTTNLPADSQVDYGTTTSYGASTALDPTKRSSHSAVLGGLAPGILYHYRARSSYSANNAAVSGDYTFTTLPDAVPPAVAITSPAAGATVFGTITISGTAADNVAVSSVAVSIDGGAYFLAMGTAAWTYSLNTVALSNASHTITAKAADGSGNIATSSVTVTVNNPVLSSIIVSPSSAAISIGATQQFIAAAYDQNGNTINGVSFLYTSTNTAAATISSTGLASGQAPGSTGIYAASGTVTSNMATLYVVNTTSPTVAITAPTNNAAVSGMITVSGTAMDNVAVSSVSISIDGGPYFLAVGTAAWTYSLNTLILSNSSHALSARAINTSGNLAISSITIIVNNSVLTSIVLSPSSATIAVGASQQFIAMAYDQNGNTISGVSFLYASTNAAAAVISSTGLATGLAPGSAGICASSGPVQSNMATLKVVDLAPPAVAITSPTNNASVSGTITVSGTAADNVAVSSVAVSVDGGAYLLASGTAAWAYGLNSLTLSNATHSLTAMATDSSGNAASVSIIVAVNNGSGGGSGTVWTVDSNGATLIFSFNNAGQKATITVTIPPGAFSGPTAVTASYPPGPLSGPAPGPVSGLRQTGIGFQIASAVQPRPDRTISIRIDGVSGVDLSKPSLVGWLDPGSGHWVPLPSNQIAGNSVTATTNHFTLFSLLQANPPGNLDSVKVFPNPFRPALGHVFVTFANLPEGSRLRIYTLAGEKVRELNADSTGTAIWEGNNDYGLHAASGVYFVLLQGGGQKRVLKVVVQR